MWVFHVYPFIMVRNNLSTESLPTSVGVFWSRKIEWKKEWEIWSKMHIFVIHKSGFCIQEKQNGPESFVLWAFITLRSFSAISLYVYPKWLILAIEVIVLATIQNSSSSNLFQLRCWNVYNCSVFSLCLELVGSF